MKSIDNVSEKELFEAKKPAEKKVKTQEEVFTPRKTEFTPEMARVGLTKYDIEDSDRYWNETQGGKLIPHEETMNDIKEEISKYKLYNDEKEIEDIFKGKGHIGGKYLTEDERNEIRNYFKENYKPVQTKTFDEVKDSKVKKASAEMDNLLGKKYRDLYESGFASINVKPFNEDGQKGYKIDFNAELDYDEMENLFEKFNAIFDKYGLDSYFEMESPGRGYAYIFR